MRSETLAGATLVPLSGWPWPGHVLQRREHPTRCERQTTALKSLHGCNAELADEVRVFAVRFLDATPARVASDVDHWSEHEMHAARANFPPDDSEYPLQQRWIPGARQRDGLRKVRGAARRVAVQALFVEQHRDAEARARSRSAEYAFTSSIVWRTSRYGVLKGLPGPSRSLGRANWPMPLGYRRRAAAGSKRPALSNSCFFCVQIVVICAIFSSCVMRASRSSTRCSSGAAGLRYAGRSARCCASARRGREQGDGEQTHAARVRPEQFSHRRFPLLHRAVPRPRIA